MTSPIQPTQEQIHLAYKLEEIFMPQARRQRRAANMGIDCAGEATRFVHYTSADAAVQIIKSKRLWMRSTTCMADYSEVQHGIAMLRGHFSDAGIRSAFKAALDTSHTGVLEEAIGMFDKRIAEITLNTFVTCVSEHKPEEDDHGRLSMWRAFGGNSARVALVFRVPKDSLATIPLNVMFSPVAYLTELQVGGVIKEVIKNIADNCELLRKLPRELISNMLFKMLQAAAACLKHQGFEEEKEWRAIYCPSIETSALVEEAVVTVNGVPQKIHKFPLDGNKSEQLAEIDLTKILERIIIGPTVYPWMISEALVAELRGIGITNPNIRASQIPIRS